MSRVNYTGGYIYEYDEPCFNSWLLIPAESFWAEWLRGVLYTFAILYIFLGIAIAADIFMLSIEMITSKKRIIFTYDFKKKQRVQREVFVWNETVANLTLMALGSSAPEILIAVFETLSSLDVVESKDALGIFTIIGSASYNLLVISAVCIISVPSNTFKRISEFGVFIITAIWSMFAYFWLLVVLKWSSPNEIEIWEAVLTLAFFPLLVLTAWGQDKGWWVYKCIKQQKMIEQISYKESFNNSSHTTTPSHLVNVQSTNPSLHSTSDTKMLTANISKNGHVNTVGKQINSTMSRAFARARFRHAVVVSMTGHASANKPEQNNYTSSGRQKDLLHRRVTPSLELTDISDIKTGTFCFSSSTYSVSKKGGNVEIDVLFNKAYRKGSHVGFSHIVDVARKKSVIMNSNTITQSTTHIALEEKNTTLPAVSELPNVQVNTSVSQSSISRHDSSESNKDNLSLKEKMISPFKSKQLNEKNISPLQKVDVSEANSIVTKRNSSIDLLNNEFILNKLNNLQNVFWIHYETREGNAKDSKDFHSTEGLLLFLENEYSKRITIPLYAPSSDCEMKDFYVVLKEPCHDTAIGGGPSIAHIYLVSEDEPGEFVFQDPTYHIQFSSQNTATATAKVIRTHGNDGKATLYYRTIDGTALGGDENDFKQSNCDYEHIEEGMLQFQSGQTSHKIMIKINPMAKKGNTFIVVLYNVKGCGKIGQQCAAIISLSAEVDEIVDQITTMAIEEEVEDADQPLSKQWKKQFEEAVSLGDSPSYGAMFLHFLCFLWKVVLAFVPPRSVFGGWAAFVVSLLTLGFMSALVEQFAKLLGCVVGLHVSITGITLVALGTSMPDTFASKTAAEQDKTADAAIGNITGSNSVNVFLGLGLPWVIKSIYLWNKGLKLTMRSSNITFTLVVFLSCGFISLVTLVVRRALFKGELGGPSLPKYLTSGMLIFLWLTFITLSSLQAYGIIKV